MSTQPIPQLDLPTASIVAYAEVILPLALPTTYTYAVPENFAVRKTSKGVVIDWDIVKQDGVKSYNIYKRSLTETSAAKVITVDIAKGNYTDTNIKSGVLYYYSLSATGEFGTSEISAERFVKY